MTANTLISVVDDDESVRDSTKTLLRSVGYQVAIFESSERFLESGLLSETRCLILDADARNEWTGTAAPIEYLGIPGSDHFCHGAR